MTSPAPIAILFANERAANHDVAGIPAAARVLREFAEDPSREILVAVEGGWRADARCRQEIDRLAPDLRWRAVDPGEVGGAEHYRLPLSDKSQRPLDIPDLRLWAHRIVKATGKPGDGIVSRHLNRPVSQAMTRILLRWPGARPWHATLIAALIGVAMALALFLGGATGLIAGAILFQLASIVDGVDGEIARATFRSSARGAMMDSVTDAATNLSFIAGVSFNLYTRGAEAAGIGGGIGFALLATGSALLALQSRRDGGDFTFDALKSRVRARPSRIRQWLVWVTMRDFYALAACIAILLGGASLLLFTFATVAAGWFAATCAMVLRPGRDASQGPAPAPPSEQRQA